MRAATVAETKPNPAPESFTELAEHLLHHLPLPRDAGHTPFLLGISGLQGCGKSTLADLLVDTAQRHGLHAVTLSLDDVYLDRATRGQLARTVHPLLATRGVPGTHDLDLLHATLDGLAAASPQSPLRLPRFDKGRDEPAAHDRWPSVVRPPSLVVLEGWCLAVPPQPEAALAAPINTLERLQDPDARWRRHVNAQLASHYTRLWQRIDWLVLLQAPSFDLVQNWRDQQEAAMRREGAPQAMDTAALQHFIRHFERLSRHALECLPARADCIVELDASRRIRSLHGAGS